MKPQILFISPRFPFPTLKGDQLVIYHRLKSLSKKYDITLLTFYRHQKQLDDLEELGKYCHSIHPIKLSNGLILKNLFKALFGRKPYQVQFFQSTSFAESLSALLNEHSFQLIHCFTLRLYPYTQKHELPVVLELIDSMVLNIKSLVKIVSPLRSFVFKQELNRMMNYEPMIAKESEAVIVVSEFDKNEIGEAKIKVIPNGVDTKKFYTLNKSPETKAPTIIFTGNMKYAPNVEAVKWFVNTCFPSILSEIPEAKFRIVGVNPAPDVLALEKIEHVEVVGFVEDLALEINEAKVAVAPMQSGSGIQNKILEAMACKTPVVTTKKGCEGLMAKSGEAIVVANKANEFAKDVISLLTDTKLNEEIGEGGHQYVQEHHSWDNGAKEVDKLYQELSNRA